ncbi:hypothetical protein [Ornithinimicrobium kibberense]
MAALVRDVPERRRPQWPPGHLRWFPPGKWTRGPVCPHRRPV